jgi:hypothetical protein
MRRSTVKNEHSQDNISNDNTPAMIKPFIKKKRLTSIDHKLLLGIISSHPYKYFEKKKQREEYKERDAQMFQSPVILSERSEAMNKFTSTLEFTNRHTSSSKLRETMKGKFKSRDGTPIIQHSKFRKIKKVTI